MYATAVPRRRKFFLYQSPASPPDVTCDALEASRKKFVYTLLNGLAEHRGVASSTDERMQQHTYPEILIHSSQCYLSADYTGKEQRDDQDVAFCLCGWICESVSMRWLFEEKATVSVLAVFRLHRGLHPAGLVVLGHPQLLLSHEWTVPDTFDKQFNWVRRLQVDTRAEHFVIQTQGVWTGVTRVHEYFHSPDPPKRNREVAAMPSKRQRAVTCDSDWTSWLTMPVVAWLPEEFLSACRARAGLPLSSCMLDDPRDSYVRD